MALRDNRARGVRVALPGGGPDLYGDQSTLLLGIRTSRIGAAP